MKKEKPTVVPFSRFLTVIVAIALVGMYFAGEFTQGEQK